jgi:hypothetical protein
MNLLDQAVEQPDPVSAFQQQPREVSANEACTSCDEYRLRHARMPRSFSEQRKGKLLWVISISVD